MSEVRLVIREQEQDWSGIVHGGCADRAIASLSADPISLDEFEAATARFQKPHSDRRFFANLTGGLNCEPHDAGLVVIDLAARLIVSNSTYSTPLQRGGEFYHDGDCETEVVLPFHLAEEWSILIDRNEWQGEAENRRKERSRKPVIDARHVFYGRPLLEYIAREVFSAVTQVSVSGADDDKADASPGWKDDNPTQMTIRLIHADWLMIPREDLGGACPREIALEDRGHLSFDIEDRCHQWSHLGHCPPGLSESSHACRYGGFGTSELVVYYYLVRELLWSCWDHLVELKNSAGLESLAVGDFLSTEVVRLERVHDAWLNSPNSEFSDRKPGVPVGRERRRLPETMLPHEAVIDPDCPCCQMNAELPGPMFWFLDGCNMDDEFAFDIYNRTRAEWEAEQRRHEEFSREMDAKWEERERLGLPGASPNGENAQEFWSRSFSVDQTDVPLGVRIFGIGSRLAELICDLRSGSPREATDRVAQEQIDRLNRDFGNLREILQNSDSSLAIAMINPVIDRFTDSLCQVASDRPELKSKCESLIDSLGQLLVPASDEPDLDESDNPF